MRDYDEISKLLSAILTNDFSETNGDIWGFRGDDKQEFGPMDIVLGIANNFDINAFVQKVEETTYLIGLLNGLFEIIPTKITEYLSRYDENDLIYFSKFEPLDYLSDESNQFEDDSKTNAQNKLANIFSSIIIIHIIFHEMGHIIANHTEEKIHKYDEFENSDKKNESFTSQEKEMVADWYATKRLTKYIFYKTTQTTDIKDPNSFFLKLIILIWLSLSLEFQIFELKLIANGNVSLNDIEKRTHPHPKVRLLYCLDALQEAILDILNEEFLISDDESTVLMTSVFYNGYIYLQSFYSLLTSVNIEEGLADEKVVTVYKKLRETPFIDSYTGRDSWKHLEPMAPEYIQSLNDWLYSIKKEK